MEEKIFIERLKLQTIYDSFINFDSTFEELNKLGYDPKICNFDQKTHTEKELTFTLKSGATIYLSSKDQPNKIKIIWNIMENSEKQLCELTSVLIPLAGEKLVIVPVSGLVHNQDYFPNEIFEDELLLQLLKSLKD